MMSVGVLKMFKIRSLVLLLVLPLVVGWGGAHRHISEVALESLAPWQREIIKSEYTNFIQTYCLIPDLYRKKEQRDIWKPYMSEVNLHYALRTEENYKAYTQYFNVVCDEFSSGNIAEGMKLAGAFSHYLQDSICPAHFRYAKHTKLTPDGPSFTRLDFCKEWMIIPEKHKDSELHKVIDGGGITLDGLKNTIGGYKPKLLGGTRDEAIFNIATEHELYMDESYHYLLPMVDAYMKDDQELFADYGNASAAFAVKLTADFLYTALCLSKERFNPEYLASLSDAVYLSDIPVSESNKLLPKYRPQQILKLKMPDNSKRIFEKGFGVEGDIEYSFVVMPDLFDTFSVYVGQNLAVDQGGGCSFQILLDGMPVKKTRIIGGLDQAEFLEVDLKSARKITIKTADRTSSSVQAVWGDPLLKKMEH